MDWNSILQSPFLRSGVCVLLIAAILLGLLLPGVELKAAQQEDPIAEESVREITVLKVGENVQNLSAIVIPSGERAELAEPEETQPEETQPEETQPEETQPEETQPEETQPEETQPEETQPEETQPEETQPEETQPEETQPEETQPEETQPEETQPEETQPEETQPEETQPEETQPEETNPEETNPEETNPEETNPEETDPEETDPEETTPEETNPGETTPEETNPGETTPEETEPGDSDPDHGGGDDGDLEFDLAMVMTWYKYGTQPNTIACAPSGSITQTVNIAQLKEDVLKYEFAPEGEDAAAVTITSVSVAEGDSVPREISDSGEIPVETRNYKFTVQASGERENAKGETITQELTFTFVLKCENNMDLDLELHWTKSDGTGQTVVCGADKTQTVSVNNRDITDRVFAYKTSLSGALKDEAEIVAVECTTESGKEPDGAGLDSGSLILTPAEGTDTETYYLTFTVKTPAREALYRFSIVYQETLDVQLSFTWLDSAMTKHTMTCQPGESVSASVKNNQLSAGALTYEMNLTGADTGDERFLSITYTSEAGDSGNLEQSGSLPMTIPEGQTSNTYRITVDTLVKGQQKSFEIVLKYANDVTLRMEYSVWNDGEKETRSVSCENTKTKTAEEIYDDQLTDGLLEYKMVVVGSDSDTVSITSVSCYQSGSGRTVTLDAQDEIQLLLKDGKTGENTFTVKAEDDAGNAYSFKINIPYKHKGTNTIQIVTNLDEETTITNETKTNLTVTAWSEDDEGNVISYIPANGTDTILTVKLDDEEVPYTSSSGTSSEYDLYPSNPEVGDTNTHTIYIYAEDSYGNFGEKTLVLTGQRNERGQKIGTAAIYVDMTVLGIGVVGPVNYDVLADEPVSYTVVKAVMGQDTGEPFGAASETFGWRGSYAGTLDDGFYLQSLSTGYSADALEGSNWPGSTEEEVLAAIDERFGRGSGLATLWRCLYRNGLNKSSGSGSSFGEFDYTSGSGWMYAIGGSTYYPGQSMSSVYLRDGDVLTLRYTLAYGWDVGGGSDGYGNSVGYCVSAINGSIHISHQMETVENADGTIVHMCHCCGLVEECAHEHLIYRNLEDGTHILYCEDCRATVGDPESHTWVHDGETADQEHTCSECGATEEHVWKEVEGSNTATCTEPGTRTVQCRICGMLREEEAPAKGHTLDNRWDYTPAEHYQRCSTCAAELNRGSHRYVYDEEWDDYVCVTCGAMHDFDVECSGTLAVTEATCRKITYHCDGCGCDLTREGVFEEYHAYVDGVCQYCGAEDPDYEPEEPTDGHEHVYTVTEQSDPTCTEAGYIVYTCDCGDTYTETLPAAGHTWRDWTVTKEATVEEEGEETRCCEVCGAEETRTIDKLTEEIQMGFWFRLFRGFL